MIEEYIEKYGELFELLKKFNTHQIEMHRATPQGVGWNSHNSQIVRFDQILRVVGRDSPAFSLNDIGCGYGALLDYIADWPQMIEYRGYDLSEAAVVTARQRHQENDHRRTQSFGPFSDIRPATYSVASGIFGLKLEESESVWIEYIIDTLKVLDRYSSSGFSFNMLTSFSDIEKRENILYYADPCFIFYICKKNFSRNVALLHDYDI